MTTEQPARICILGGGFGGLYTALRLSELPAKAPHKPEIVLIDRNDRFLFSPLLYELVSGELQTWEIAPPFEEVLANTGVRFIQASVSDIHLDSHQVLLDNGSFVHYDRLVLAMGGETPLDKVPGCDMYALPFRTVADAYRLQERLRVLEQSEKEKIRVVIVGAGYSGVELACKLADRLGNRGRVRLIEQGDTILRTSAEFNRQTASQALEQRKIWLDLETSVEAVGPDTISLRYRGVVDEIPADLVLWTSGTKVVPVLEKLPLKQNPRGQFTVTSTLQAIDNPEIFVVGDLADCVDASGSQVPATAQVALQQADYAGWNIWASLTNRPLLPFRYQSSGEMMTLGIDNATLTGLGIKLDGTVASLVRRLAYLYRMPTFDHQLKVAFNWIAQPLRDLLSNG
ncbi:NAD(P)/FAD-dependent oxidoreductase [Ancylothrix sp. C2]|uniref:NAD(P)/FAD-dependent oxidoreductase n=1 Tax=Ancylothrix sp. D3o TaxID=2953691 RepID=UPI0021BB3C1B|nr:NAD(P)/FAD-dependent oxidoreductase [Ancylothrix sp. D3o]MCT7949247.1 NAD(P)/FAD-dependent oxidoreductase [Ancylothrix sp. D3o]